MNAMTLTKIQYTFAFQSSEKIYICLFSVLIFWKFSEKIKKLLPHIPLSLSDPVFEFRRRLKNPIAQISKQRVFRRFSEGKFEGKEGRVGLTDFQMTFWRPEKNYSR